MQQATNFEPKELFEGVTCSNCSCSKKKDCCKKYKKKGVHCKKCPKR